MFLRCYLISPYSVTPWLGGPSLYTPTLWSLDAVTKSNTQSRKETAYPQEHNTHASRGEIFAHPSILAPGYYLFLSFPFLEEEIGHWKRGCCLWDFWDSIMMNELAPDCIKELLKYNNTRCTLRSSNNRLPDEPRANLKTWWRGFFRAPRL